MHDIIVNIRAAFKAVDQLKPFFERLADIALDWERVRHQVKPGFMGIF